MSHRRRIALLGALICALATTGFVVAPTTTAATTPGCGAPRHLDPGRFPAQVRVTNPRFPLVPGAHWVTSGTVAGSGHRVVTTVTDLTKVIDGVQVIVVLDEDFDGSQLAEAELAFFAQDRRGTEWGLGEYPELYDNGVFTGAPSTWISGLDGAHAGIAMLAHPHVGSRSYLQGLAPAVGFEDCAQVFATGQQVCEPTGCYHDVLVTDEWGPLDPTGGHQRKFYAAGVGLVRVAAVGGTDPEVLHLTTTTHLCPAALTTARNTALRLDRHGYQVSPNVYGKTPHARQTLHAPTC
ncbi:MAG TPA: hypothetical protein VGD84_16350 [Pseudonocardiaceae bacterium]